MSSIGSISGVSHGIGPLKCFKYMRAVLFEAENVVNEESRHRAAGRNRGEHRGRFKRGNDADQIAEQHEDKKCAGECYIFRPIVADDFVGLLTLEDDRRVRKGAAVCLACRPRGAT